MDVDVILTAHQATQFLDGEIGEVNARVVMTSHGPRIALVAFQAKVLTSEERTILLGLQNFLFNALSKAQYKLSKRPDGQEG